ncbi:MAG: hypothetical protein ACRDZ5_11290 [Acidimicrobiales bacterium]
MSTHTCPYCGLAFTFRSEVEWHIREDHRSKGDERAAFGAELAGSSSDLSWAQLHELQAGEGGVLSGPSVSLLLGTRASPAMTSLDAARLRELARQARRRLDVEPGLRLRGPLEDRLEMALQAAEHSSTSNGLAVLVNPQRVAVVRLPFDPGENVTVDPSFRTRDLLDALQHFEPYRMAVLGTRPRVLELQEGHLVDVIRKPRPEGAGRAPSARKGGKRSPRRERWSTRRALHRSGLYELGLALDERVRVAGDLPLLVVGNPRWLSAFKASSRHASSVIGEMRGSRSHTSGELLAELAEPVLASSRKGHEDRAISQLGEVDRSGRVVWGVQEVWRALNNDSVKRMWVERGFSVPALPAGASGELRLVADPATPGVIDDIVDDMIEIAMLGSLDVEIVGDGRLSVLQSRRHLGPAEPIAAELKAESQATHAMPRRAEALVA